MEVKPVDVGGATEVEIKRNALCASRSLFWNVKVAVLAKGWGFAVLSGSVKHVTLRLFKRLPAWLVLEALRRKRLIVWSTAEGKVSNGIRASLSSAGPNGRLVGWLPSVETTEVVVRTEYNGPFRPVRIVWTRSAAMPRRHLRTFVLCEAFGRF
ncbi:MAG: hypothetical protein ACTS42_00830 [Candidatus Hodgkinia cicadicola]